MDGEFIETLFQHFEDVPQTLASTETAVEDPPMKMASFRDARAVVKKGGCADWGQLPDCAKKTNKFGLGSLQKLKRPFGMRGSEDLPCSSAIQE